MKCDICGEEKDNLIRFYWGFFKTEYEPEKWVCACKGCIRRYQRACGNSYKDRIELKNIEAQIIRRRKKWQQQAK